MKLIIDIDETSRERLFDIANNDLDIPIGLENIMIMAIVNGTPIPDNATNGDMIISLYPNHKYTIQNSRVITTIGVASSFDEEWWNSPYQKGGKE